MFVFSHDSFGVGSTGPSHQPVEILASFRAMPKMHVFRPADAVETAESWAIAMESKQTPSLLALSKQQADQLRVDVTKSQTAKGAYILCGAEGARDVTLLATGAEVGLAVSARKELANRGIRAAVVSMPCWELFEDQPSSYQAKVLGTAPRIGIETAMRFGWDKWLRPADRFIGMTGFGVSDQSDVLYRHFGITVDEILISATAI